MPARSAGKKDGSIFHIFINPRFVQTCRMRKTFASFYGGSRRHLDAKTASKERQFHLRRDTIKCEPAINVNQRLYASGSMSKHIRLHGVATNDDLLFPNLNPNPTFSGSAFDFQFSTAALSP